MFEEVHNHLIEDLNTSKVFDIRAAVVTLGAVIRKALAKLHHDGQDVIGGDFELMYSLLTNHIRMVKMNVLSGESNVCLIFQYKNIIRVGLEFDMSWSGNTYQFDNLKISTMNLETSATSVALPATA